MKIVHVVPAIAEEASGPSYSVPRLCEALIGQGQDVSLATLDWSPTSRNLPYLRTFPMDAGWPLRLGASRAMRRWLYDIAESGEPAIFHNHGMWQMNALYPGWAAKRSGGRCRLVVAPRGALSVWAMRYGSALKGAFWSLLQRRALDTAVCFHATAESEYLDIRRRGFHQPVAIIPNGIDLPDIGDDGLSNTAVRTLLFLGRIHKVKGLDMLLPAWASLQNRYPQWRLVIAGSDTGYGGRNEYLAEVHSLVDHLRAERVEFVGELLGTQKWQALRQSDLFVLPSYSENFGMAVAEALASGTPAVVTQGAPWHGLNENGAGWWVETNLDSVIAALGDAMSRPQEELATMGRRGRRWAQEQFCWTGIGAKMAETYQWLAGELEVRPSWVTTD